MSTALRCFPRRRSRLVTSCERCFLVGRCFRCGCGCEIGDKLVYFVYKRHVVVMWEALSKLVETTPAVRNITPRQKVVPVDLIARFTSIRRYGCDEREVVGCLPRETEALLGKAAAPFGHDLPRGTSAQLSGDD